MESSSEEQESLGTKISLEVKSLADVQPGDVDDLDRLVESETTLYANEPAGPTKEEMGTSAYAHAFALSALNDFIRKMQDVDLILAKDSKGQLLGYSLVGLDLGNPDMLRKVRGAFIGVRTEYKRMGLGTEILKKRIKLLKDKGIKGYVADSRNEVLGLYDRAGVSYETQPLFQGPNVSKIAKSITVKF